MQEPSIQHFYGVCERTGVGLLQEPLNVISSLGFILVAALVYRYYHKHDDYKGQRIWDIHALTFLTFIIGLGSMGFHSHPTIVTELIDIIPIVLFIVIYFTSTIFRITKVKPFEGAVVLVAFVGFTHILVAQFPNALNDSIGYLSTMIALILIAIYLNMKRRSSARQYMLAAIIGVCSLSFRALDNELCDIVPFGTHFLWHTLNATLIYILMMQIIRNVNRRARMLRAASEYFS